MFMDYSKKLVNVAPSLSLNMVKTQGFSLYSLVVTCIVLKVEGQFCSTETFLHHFKYPNSFPMKQAMPH